MGTIANIRSMRGMGIHVDRTAHSPSLQLRRYNLVYGFNGSGKSTLSRLFASLQADAPHPMLPDGAAFEVEMDDGAVIGCPAAHGGLDRRVLVFNSDYVEQNLQWSSSRANPVFYIGADQAGAAAELTRVEGEIVKAAAAAEIAAAAERAADKAFATFKRERARQTASRLHLGSRKYEAPTLAKDFETWRNHGSDSLSDEQLTAMEDIRRLEEPMARVAPLAFDATSIGKAYDFIMEICGQSLATVALDEARRFPDMLLWLKQGHEFHEASAIDDCLFCGNAISAERRARLASALDDRIDQFVARLSRTAERLHEVDASLSELERALPDAEDLSAELRPGYREVRAAAVEEAFAARAHLAKLAEVLAAKRERPAMPATTSLIPPKEDVVSTVDRLAAATSSINVAVEGHNAAVGDFTRRKEEAETAIRRHFLIECRDEYAKLAGELDGATAKKQQDASELAGLRDAAAALRQLIRAHGPAAGVINRTVECYLGHSELTVHPIDEGYQLQRHGRPLVGAPSEGEKTAIAISYFLSSIEADNRRIGDAIVVVDDPVSSLDTKALNFACSLVRNRLEKAGQLFILTHNLQCMNEFKKAWKGRVREGGEREPTATFLFIDVAVPEGGDRRRSTIVRMSKLLREYDSEYHFLFSHLLRFLEQPDAYDDHGYMIPNVLRRVLDVFLAFKCPGSSGLSGQLDKLCADYPDLDRDGLGALERLAQVESHSDNLDDLLSFSTMTLEGTRRAAASLVAMMEHVDARHLAGVRRLCR